MKPNTIRRVVGALGLCTASALYAGTFQADFNNAQVPAGSAVWGSAVVEATGGVGDSGVLKLTKSVNDQQGSLVIEDFDAGATVYGFQATMKARIGGGSPTPADGWSFNFGPDLPDGPITEEGAGTGLSVVFDTYDNGSAEAPAIDVKVGGAVVISTKVPIGDLITGSTFGSVTIRLNANGSLDLDYNGKVIYTNYFLPNYTPLAGARFAFGAKTGGLNENAFIDDLAITTYLQPQVGIARQPQDVTVLEGRAATFSAGLINAADATLQWLRDGTPISGANADTYQLASASSTDDGARLSLRITAPSGTQTTREAILRVARINLPATPVASFNFNDGMAPLNTAVWGTAYIDMFEGVDNSGVLKLTLAEGSQAGSFIVEDPHAGAPVYGFGARFKVRLGSTENPADGFSFNFASDIPDAATGELENGQGTGVTVSFDTYDNGAGEAPAAELRIGGAIIATAKVPVGFFVTGDEYQDVVINLGPDGLFDLAWNGTVLFNRISAPGFSSIFAGRFSLAARTGGAFATHWIDDLEIFTYTSATVVRISTQPRSQSVLLGRSAAWSVTVNLPEEATYQWYRDGQLIAGATANTYAIPSATLDMDGGKYKVVVKGPSNEVTSDEVFLSVLAIPVPANPQVNFDFNSGAIPANAQIYGTSFVDASGGNNDSGVLKLTIAENSQNGSFIINTLEGGAELNAFTAAFLLRMGGGSGAPADGFSFNFANDFPSGTLGDAEDGAGTGLTVAFDIYDNAGGEAPSVDIKHKGQVLFSKKMPISALRTGDAYTQVLLRVSTNGVLDLAYGDQIFYEDFLITNWAGISGGRFALAGRTGGLNENIWIDDLKIAASKATGPTRITSEPAHALVLAGQTATFSVLVNDPAGVTFQWTKNGVAVPGATQASYTTPALSPADSGSSYAVTATGAGSVSSAPATVTVLSPFTVPANPQVALDFNDVTIPLGGAVWGTAMVDFFGGINDSGVMKLTINENSQAGSFVLDAPEGTELVHDLTASWQLRIGGGTATPADGFAFAVGPDIPDAPFGQEGTGSGLSIGFDTFNNAGGEAPAIDVFYQGEVVGSRKVPIAWLSTGDQFRQVFLRLERDGTLDLICGTNAIFANLQLPDFTPIPVGRFGFGAQTGGLNDNHWVDDVFIALNTMPALGPKLTFSREANGSYQISWPGGGALQSTTDLSSTWSDVAGAASPYTVQANEAQRFYRVKQ